MSDKVSEWMEAIEIAGFSLTEAERLFGAPDPAVYRDLSIRLRPPAEARAEFTQRHADLQAAMI
jgi:hypothetical protein